MEKKNYYRPEIDGLRALAIIPVLLFHAGVAGFAGGFMGVDIFFVISGFLITSIIIREIKEETFSLVGFWERRVRRIMPVMFVVMLTVAIAAYFILLFPVDFIDFGQSLVAQSLFLVNIFFMRKSNYFAGPSESMPLLHTWSLSVEEQFYLVFPVLLMSIWLMSKKFFFKLLVPIFIVIAMLSFFYNLYLVEWYPGNAFSLPLISYIWGAATNINAGFFLILPRAWELLLGALLATGIFVIRKKSFAELFSYTGLAIIIYSIVTFDETTPFPGYVALLPTFGTLFIIASNTHVKTSVGKFLSFPVFVWVGLISYSLYLWHWPLIVFAKTLYGDGNYVPVLLALVLAFGLSWVTYRYVETPFRKRSFIPKQLHMFLFGFGAICILVALGLLIHFANGFPNRASEVSRSIATAAADTNPRTYECFRKNFREIFSVGEPCFLGVKTDRDGVDFVLWGDSHADATMPIIDTLAKERGYTGVFFGAGGCRPIVWEHEVVEDQRCVEIKEQAISYITENNIQKVLLISSWESGGAIKLSGDNSKISIDTEQEFYDALQSTLERIEYQTRSVYVLKRVPIFETYDIRKEFNRSAQSNDIYEPVTQSREEYVQSNKIENKVLDIFEANRMVITIDPYAVFCSESVCSMALDKKIVYKDGTHINTTGAMYMRPLFEDFFTN